MVARVPGFCLKGICLDNKTTLYVNVCGDDSVGLPLARNMDPIPSPTYMDTYGIDNLIIPIAIDEPSPLDPVKDPLVFVVDAVIHSAIVQRVKPSHHMFEHMLTRVTALAVQWVAQETGMKLIQRSVHLYPQTAYMKSVKSKEDANMDSFMKSAKELVDSLKTQEAEQKKAEEVSPNPLRFVNMSTADESQGEKKKGPLIQEVLPEAKGLKKGFLSQTNGLLYPSGSSEGKPPPPRDPLAFMPDSLRKKCKVVDTREEASQSNKPTASSGIVIEDVRPPAAAAPVKSLWGHSITKEETGCIVVTITPPPFITKVADLEDLTIDEKGININYGQYVIPLEPPFDYDSATAKFVKKTNLLVVRCPPL